MVLKVIYILYGGGDTTMKTVTEPVKEGEGKAPTKWAGMGPVVLSAVVFPGVGQLMQRRWVAGAGYAVSFGVAFGWLMLRFFGLMKIYYSLAFEFNQEPGDAPSLGVVGWPFLVSLVIYVASLVDTAAGNRPPGRRGPPPTFPP